MATDISLDVTNRIVILEATQLSYTVQEIHSKTKELLLQAPNIDDDSIFQQSGFDELNADDRTGVIAKLQNGWTVEAETQGSPTIVSVQKGIILPETLGGTVYNAVVNISYFVADATVSALLGGASVSLQDVADAMRILPTGTVITNSVDDKLDQIITAGGGSGSSGLEGSLNVQRDCS